MLHCLPMLLRILKSHIAVYSFYHLKVKTIPHEKFLIYTLLPYRTLSF